MGRDEITEAVVLSLAIGVMSITISKTYIFVWLRMWLHDKAPESYFWMVLYELTRCPYCLSHWCAIIGVLVYDVRLIHSWIVLDYFISAMAITALATFTGAILYRAYQPPQVRERVKVGKERTRETTPRGNS